MFKKLLLTSFLLLSVIGILYPSKKENTKLLDYCFPLEKILSRNSIQKSKNISGQFESVAKDIAKYGVNRTKGSLVRNILNRYKNSKDSLIINYIPNEIFCLVGYWIEKINPGTFESIFMEKSKNKLNEFKDLKEEVDELIKDINLEYEVIKEEFNSIF